MTTTTTTAILDAKATAKFREKEEETTPAAFVPWADERGEIVPCGTCGNDFAEYNCTCEAPTWEHFDY